MSEVIREEHKDNFSIISNSHLKDKHLSLKAKGLLTMMLSLPPTWKYNVTGLSFYCRDGVDSVRSALNELQDNGYLTRERERLPNGRYGENNYVIREKPMEDQVE